MTAAGKFTGYKRHVTGQGSHKVNAVFLTLLSCLFSTFSGIIASTGMVMLLCSDVEDLTCGSDDFIHFTRRILNARVAIYVIYVHTLFWLVCMVSPWCRRGVDVVPTWCRRYIGLVELPCVIELL